MADAWPIDWPDDTPDDLDPLVKARAEDLAALTLRMLTLYRVGGTPITVMPCGSNCRHPRYSMFHPILLETGRIANCWCESGCGCSSLPSVELVAPVGRIDEVQVNGEIVPAEAYHVEDGNKLVRTDGKAWPVCAGPKFTVTYLNAYAVDSLGQFVGGILAREFLTAASGDAKKCRLPASVTSITRQGMSMTIAPGMFPNGQTGIAEVDTYIRQWNPHGMKVAPTVSSVDSRRKQRQITLP